MTIRSTALYASLFLLGAGFGGLRPEITRSLEAQNEPLLEAPLSEDAANQVRAVNRSLESARDELDAEGRYKSITEPNNPFLILAGGGDAMADLESGNGVDPETFAALYAGLASDSVKEDISLDDEGRIRYKGDVVRMYSIKRLKALFARRAELGKAAGN